MRLPVGRQPRVLLATGRITRRINVDQALVVDVIRKPFDIAGLHRTVERTLKSTR